MGCEISILQQTFFQFMAITANQLLDQTAQRGLLRDHNRLLAPPHETLDETDKGYFHLNTTDKRNHNDLRFHDRSASNFVEQQKIDDLINLDRLCNL